jgi:hypothetical protein
MIKFRQESASFTLLNARIKQEQANTYTRQNGINAERIVNNHLLPA